MKRFFTRRRFLRLLAMGLAGRFYRASGQDDRANLPPKPRRGGPGGRGRGPRDYRLPPDLASDYGLSLILGRASDRSVTISAMAQEAVEGYIEYGPASNPGEQQTELLHLNAGVPLEVVIEGLKTNARYSYRFHFRKPGMEGFPSGQEGRFQTQRARGHAFTFTVQGDSHPERPQMSDPALYARTLLNVAHDQPDFHLCMGDDFSVDTLRAYSEETVASRYTLQRPFLGLVGRSAPLFLLNGNHEQASLFNFSQPGTPREVAVWAQKARNRFFPTLAPDGFYAGDSQRFESIGLLKDYYSWTWGDALFVVLDNYWHAPVLVDSPLGGDSPGGRPERDWWGLTLGDAQYHWFKQTLEQSPSTYKFVFAHHVLGSGRGGIDEASFYEWGGKNRRGEWEFDQKRPGWELPVHQLMAKHGVTIFFQGHDHLYARQELDGIVYQEVPMPADQGYVAYNDDRYESGTKLPNSGHLRIHVSPEQVEVEYRRSYLPQDESAHRRTGEIAHRYVVGGKGNRA